MRATRKEGIHTKKKHLADMRATTFPLYKVNGIFEFPTIAAAKGQVY